MMYQRDGRTATISNPFYCTSTHYRPAPECVGIRVRMVAVFIDGKQAFAAPTEVICKDWLIRCGFRPVRSD